MYIAVDFDGTCVTHEFPEIGKEIGAAEVLKKLASKGHKIILNTMRSDKLTVVNGVPRNTLQEATKWFEDHGIKLYGVNRNPSQWRWTTSNKVHADVFIDDLALGCPLVTNKAICSRPYVDWEEVATWFYNYGVFEEKDMEDLGIF